MIEVTSTGDQTSARDGVRTGIRISAAEMAAATRLIVIYVERPAGPFRRGGERRTHGTTMRIPCVGQDKAAVEVSRNVEPIPDHTTTAITWERSGETPRPPVGQTYRASSLKTIQLSSSGQPLEALQGRSIRLLETVVSMKPRGMEGV